ncbi:hypothetical protein Pcinc_025355 [Petrolisthes cinctipes]|uniref:Exosome complex component 10 homolog n=1 Tax=Petrolisthes cinctipes TaxID=88211 RepID=A0AAE1F8M6_PETCI|nr:hypothetical protein Pcinc_025355 [Petrolisthes cinctipes]
MDTGPPSFTGGKKMDDFVKSAMMDVKRCQKMAMELQGWQHYRDYPGVQQTIDQVNSTISSVIGNIFCHQDIKLDLSDLRLSDKLEMIREGNDALLERINSDVDEAAGVKKNHDEELMTPVIKKVQAPSTPGRSKNVVLLAARNVQKPQLFFTEKISNSAKQPFVPFLTEKPNSLKPLSILICLDPTGREYYSHPYEYELNHWNPEPNQLEYTEAIPPRPMKDSSLIMIDTEHDLMNLVKQLSKCTEIAVDLEHHAFRSYLGLTCLMQISTRTTDYIVDTLALRGKLTILNEVFTHRKITKVIHGSDYDVLWLQRDCGVYLVNLFDTHQAAIVLEYPHRSLAALLHRFCDIQANKIFQRADWRIRPLPEEFIEYARQDTHSLLYIYDQLKIELIDKGNNLNNLITSVYDRSRELCLKRYEKPIVGRESHQVLYRHSRKAFNSKQMFALRELYLWRDKVGREQDESPEYVLPKHMLLQIAEVLPKEMQGILACCNPIPPLVKTELLTLHTIIREAREQPIVEIKQTEAVPSVQEYQNTMETLTADLNPNLTCKHDLSHCEDDAKEMPTLMNSQMKFLNDDNEVTTIIIGLKSSSDLFDASQHAPKPTLPLDIKEVFTSPFERYTAYQDLKPYLEEEKDKKKRVGYQDLDKMNRVKEHFLTLTNNTPEEFKMAPTRTFSGATRVEADGSMIEFEGKHQDNVDAEENKKKEKTAPKKYSMQEKIQMDRAQKSGKRKSTGNDNENESPPKVQKVIKQENEEETGVEADGESTKVKEEDEEMEDKETEGGSTKVKEEEEETEDNLPETMKESPQQGFSYDAQDFTIFLKAQRKLQDCRQKVKDGFRGKNQKNKRGKSSMKSFTWGNNTTPKGPR